MRSRWKSVQATIAVIKTLGNEKHDILLSALVHERTHGLVLFEQKRKPASNKLQRRAFKNEMLHPHWCDT